jgi:hypothetical protein
MSSFLGGWGAASEAVAASAAVGGGDGGGGGGSGGGSASGNPSGTSSATAPTLAGDWAGLTDADTRPDSPRPQRVRVHCVGGRAHVLVLTRASAAVAFARGSLLREIWEGEAAGGVRETGQRFGGRGASEAYCALFTYIMKIFCFFFSAALLFHAGRYAARRCIRYHY